MSEIRGRQARMQVNVTNKEYFVKEREPLITKTDTKGKITFANAAFVEISGYTLDELLGQPHNMVRHPDMPREAFKDLWDTLQNDQPWNGLVKNRSKDGGFYWVEANVVPIMERGKKIGYLSVRGMPSASQKQQAQALYDAINRGQQLMPKTPLNSGRPFLVDLAIASLFPCVVSLGTLLPYDFAHALFAVLGLSASLAGMFWIRSCVKEMNFKINSSLEAMSEGNFKNEIPKSTIREFNGVFTNLKKMQLNLRAIISDVLCSSSKVSHDSNELSELAHHLMERSLQQSDGVSGVASALEELSVSVSEISDATNKSTAHANKAMKVVDEGAECMQRSTSATEQVAKVVQGARSDIEKLNNAVSKISNVTATIEAIAEKTNLLALNAAIEAARAGETGRGFAVVADEVRKLAEMTRQSTTEISATVEDVQNGTRKALATMEDAVHEVQHSTRLIGEANESLTSIRQTSQGIADSARDISSMLEQQSSASHDVANSMEKIGALNESNVAGIRQLEGASKQLTQVANSLGSLVDHFRASL